MPSVIPPHLRPPCPKCRRNRIRAKGSRQCNQCRIDPGWHRKKNAVPHDAMRSDETPPAMHQARSVKESGDAAELTQTTSERVKTLADVIRICEIDTDVWDIERHVINKWDMAAMPRATGNDKDGWRQPHTRPLITELYQVKVWLKRRVSVIATRTALEALLADAKKRVPPRPFKASAGTPGVMLELNPTDLHLGKLAWAEETGWEHYDGKLAEAAMDSAVEAILRRVGNQRFERVVMVIGNDFFHSDTKAGTTTKGTPLDNDSRYHKTFLQGYRLLARTGDRIAAHVAPIEFIVVPGNHDTLSAFHLGHALECYYHKTKHVRVDNAPTMRKYVQHGRVMLMFTHGNTGKLADYPLLMAREQPRMWAETQHREAHTGDKHQLRVQEHHGIRVRILPALCAADAWHSDNHYVGMLRSTEAFLWDRQEGLIGTAIHTIQETR